MSLKSYKDLIVWQKSYELVLEMYKATEVFPKSELYSLVQQMRRAAISIPSNIAEGYTRGHRLEYIQFLSIAFGSVAELETQLLISKELGYIKEEAFKKCLALLEEIMKMLSKLIKVLK